jgi:REP element-mobilizing transposase RayT
MPPPHFSKSEGARTEHYDGKHRFEHWYRDNTVYFITARCKNRFAALASEEAKSIFWDRFLFHTSAHGFEPWITSLLDNHYHTLGYLPRGNELGEMMRKIHGSVAKLVNDTLVVRLRPFWKDSSHKDYFDGCLRDGLQYVRAYRYMARQSERHGICADYRRYPHTRIVMPMEEGLRIATERNAFLESVPYKRYQRNRVRGASSLK